jgi:hypothetical protein
MRLRDRETVPPGGWRWKDADLGFDIEACDLWDLARRVNQVRGLNSLMPIPNLARVIEETYARHLGGIWAVAEDGEPALPEVVNWTQAQRVTDEFMTAMHKHSAFRMQGLAKRKERLSICQKCIHFMPLGCITCNGIAEWIRTRMKIERDTSDKHTHACDLDNIYNLARFDFGLTSIRASVPNPYRYPASCWMNEPPLETHHES